MILAQATNSRAIATHHVRVTSEGTIDVTMMRADLHGKLNNVPRCGSRRTWTFVKPSMVAEYVQRRALAGLASKPPTRRARRCLPERRCERHKTTRPRMPRDG